MSRGKLLYLAASLQDKKIDNLVKHYFRLRQIDAEDAANFILNLPHEELLLVSDKVKAGNG